MGSFVFFGQHCHLENGSYVIDKIMNRIEQLLSFLAIDANDAFTLYSLAHEHKQAGEMEKALAYFEELREKHPTYTGLYYHLGKVYEAIGEKEKGMAIFEIGVQIAEKQRDMHALAELRTLIVNREMGIEED